MLTLNPWYWGGGRFTPPSPLVYCTLLKISLGNSYLKTRDLAILFVADAPMKKNSKFSLPPLRALLNMGLKTTHGLEGEQVFEAM